MQASNFEFLEQYAPQLVRLGSLAERFFHQDRNTCLLKLRQFGELLAQLTAIQAGLFDAADEKQVDLLRRLKFDRIISIEVADLFHQIRLAGNIASHEYTSEHADVLTLLKMARQLGIWFHRTFGEPKFKPQPFISPLVPIDPTAELARLQLTISQTQTEAEIQAQARLNVEERVRIEAEERLFWEQIALESESTIADLTQQLATLEANTPKLSTYQTTSILQRAAAAAQKLDLDEAQTRAIIDRQLRDCGWEADTQSLRYQEGTRAVKGRNIAIAEYPTRDGVADYALFVGTFCIGVVEAKRRRKNVSGAIDQAERYAKGLKFTEETWGKYGVPFVFATNGRPYLKQIETESGIWFRDVRLVTNLRRALTGFPTPDGLTGQLKIDREQANAALKTQSFNFGFPLRYYQQNAIEAVEAALESDRRSMLVAMATGTGKTKLAIALLYRLLTAKRFRRVCFVVDRSALGTQTGDEFKTTKIVSSKTFAEIFGLQGVKDIEPESETKVHICTIQGLVKRVLYAKEPGDVPTVDRYDLIIIDECHRGYLLDREMSDAELSFRSQDDYISKYRRVLEHFDAVKIGLTATPALHTKEIFGEPIYKYSYREAVIDGFLIDHEPPFQIGTELSRSGIDFQAQEEIEVYDAVTGTVDLTNVPDDLHFDVDKFNKQVITVPFNRAIANELAIHIDPNLPGKTLIFAATDAHADILVDELKAAFETFYGEIEDGAVRKITGTVDRVGTLIKEYRNDRLPNVAVTVDLLTTGIDVPKITNLVFLRRVNSRILYEQMLGRATRQCDEIGKETFRIFDAVDVYAKMQTVSEMKPIVVNPKINLAQLFAEFSQVTNDEHRQEIRDQILVKLRRKLRTIPQPAQDSYEAESGETIEMTLQRFKTAPLTETARWVGERPQLGQILDWNPDGTGTRLLPISHHPDEVISVTRGYGLGQKPDDFLDSFTAYVRENMNQITALTIVLQRPRELTRAQLRELRLELDKLGFSDTALQQAWRDTKNEDMAASIIGFIRQAALGDALIPYDERVDSAIRRIIAKHSWTYPQQQWLKKIGNQVAREIIVDRAAIDQEPFQADGGFKRLDKVFNGQLEAILGDIQEELWVKRA